MFLKRLALAGLIFGVGIGTAACTDGYGYSGVSVGYGGGGYYDDGYGYADPYYGGGNGFDLVLDYIEDAADGLLIDLRGK